MKRSIDKLSAVFSYSKSKNQTYSNSSEYKSSIHPVVSVHPITKIQSIFVNSADSTEILGQPDNSLLNFLIEHVERPEFIYTHKWEQDDLVIWDNRGILIIFCILL